MPTLPHRACDRNLESWSLVRLGEDLHWGGCNLRSLGESYGTPLYVVNAGVLKRCYDSLREVFQEEDFDPQLFFSCKTNPVPGVLSLLAGWGCGLEVISEFEFWLAGKTGVSAGNIVVNGPAKTGNLLRQAVSSGAALINVESLEELKRLREIAADLDQPAKVGLRVNPCVRGSRFDFTVSSGTRKSHAGFRRSDRDWREALGIVAGDPRLQMQGLHFHLGSAIGRATPYIAALRSALEMATDLLERGLPFRLLDMGGGFGTPTVKAFSLFDAIRYFGWARPPGIAAPEKHAFLLPRIALEYSKTLKAFARNRGIPVPLLWLEPGRALVSSAQLLLLRVQSVRKRKGGPHVVTCDSGAMSLSPLLWSETHRIFSVSRKQDSNAGEYDIVGNLPAPLDLVALRQRLPSVEPGNLLAIMDTGAYFTSLGNNFAGPRPAVALIENEGARLIRTRESFAEMVSRDL
jgi:diaminopimelate decarboxylase